MFAAPECLSKFNVALMRAMQLACAVLVSLGCGGQLVQAEEFAPATRPNILWITCEDASVDWFGCYGNSLQQTPNIDGLAEAGFRYTRCFANLPVCAPMRSTWLTGIHAISMGTHPMRSRYRVGTAEQPLTVYPQYLRREGYYCVNSSKTDYNLGGQQDRQHWDRVGAVDWQELKNQQPFFQVWNLTQSHESSAHGELDSVHFESSQIRLAAYHPDLPVLRKNYGKYYEAIAKLDRRVGVGLAKLAEQGLDENTIVIFNSDHGGVLPRSKRFLYRSGLHCPLIIRFPKGYQSWWPANRVGASVDDLVSFVDMPRTWLELCGIQPPDSMHGITFLGPNRQPRQWHFAYRARMDERVDNVRAVTNGRMLYIRNMMPFVPNGQKLRYLWRQQAMQAWAQAYADGRCDEITGRFFRPRVVEELYDISDDPDNIRNLVDDARYRQQLLEAREALRDQQLKFRDTGLLPESMLHRQAGLAHQTVFGFCQSEASYPLERLLELSERALLRDPGQLPQLASAARADQEGVRFWAAVGCLWLAYDAAMHVDDAKFLPESLGQVEMTDEQAEQLKSVLLVLRDDSSPEIRAYAAWALVELGGESAQSSINELERLLGTPAPARLEILNIIDWMGAPGSRLENTLRRMDRETASDYERRLLETLTEKFQASSK